MYVTHNNTNNTKQKWISVHSLLDMVYGQHLRYMDRVHSICVVAHNFL